MFYNCNSIYGKVLWREERNAMQNKSKLNLVRILQQDYGVVLPGIRCRDGSGPKQWCMSLAIHHGAITGHRQGRALYTPTAPHRQSRSKNRLKRQHFFLLIYRWPKDSLFGKNIYLLVTEINLTICHILHETPNIRCAWN